MERDDRYEVDLPDVEIPDDGGAIVPPEPPERGGGGPGGGGGAPRRRPEPFFESRWAAAGTAVVLLLFGLQTLAVMAVSRSGLGNEAVAWALGGFGVVLFVGLLWVGAKFIERHRRASDLPFPPEYRAYGATGGAGAAGGSEGAGSGTGIDGGSGGISPGTST